MNILSNGLTSLNLLVVDSSIYAKGDTKLSEIIEKIIRMVGGVGGLCFTLAVLIIAVFIIFGSISPKNIGKWWIAFFSCLGGAALFFSAFMLSGILSGLFA